MLRSHEAKMFEKQGVPNGGGALFKIGAQQYFGRLMTLWGGKAEHFIEDSRKARLDA